jgi:hypothetical protein
MLSHSLFTFGSLMYPRVWQAIVEDAHASAEAYLHGFKRNVIKYDSYPVLVPSGGNTLVGRLYFGIAGKDFYKLDAFEGQYYWRKLVYVSINEQCHLTHTYFLKPKFSHLASNREWSSEKFFKSHLPNFCARFC